MKKVTQSTYRLAFHVHTQLPQEYQHLGFLEFEPCTKSLWDNPTEHSSRECLYQWYSLVASVVRTDLPCGTSILHARNYCNTKFCKEVRNFPTEPFIVNSDKSGNLTFLHQRSVFIIHWSHYLNFDWLQARS